MIIIIIIIRLRKLHVSAAHARASVTYSSEIRPSFLGRSSRFLSKPCYGNFMEIFWTNGEREQFSHQPKQLVFAFNTVRFYAVRIAMNLDTFI